MKLLKIIPRMAVGLIFIYASASKLAEPSLFAEAIANYRLLPPQLINITAIWLPWLELGIGLGLVFGKFVRGSAALASLLMAIFTVAVSVSYARGLDISCGCFTTSPDAVSDLGTVIIRDSALLLLCLLVLVRSLTERQYKFGPRKY